MLKSIRTAGTIILEAGTSPDSWYLALDYVNLVKTKRV